MNGGRPDPYPEPEPEMDGGGVREKLRDAIDPDRDRTRPGGRPENPEREVAIDDPDRDKARPGGKPENPERLELDARDNDRR